MGGRVGIVGLGIMGSAYAKNLIAAGVTVEGGDPSKAAQQRLQALGGVPHAAAGDWLAACDLVILALISPQVLHSVTADLTGILSPGQIVLETGTFALDDKIAARDLLAGAGIHLLDCPVSGTGAQAANGDILMMASGPGAAIDDALPYMRHFTKDVIRAGDFGAGTRLKFVANHAVALHNTAAAETLNYARALGLDGDLVYKMLSTGAGQSKMSDLRMPLMLQQDYDPPTASLKMFDKDISVIGADIERLGVQAPLFRACEALYQTASDILPETHDTAAIYEVYRTRRAKS